MSNLQDALDKRKGESTPLLKGSDLPRKQNSVTVKCTGVREAPASFGSPAIMDFEPMEFNGSEFGAIPLNKTNTKALLAIVGDTPLESIRGTATFERMLQNNPQTNAPSQGLVLAAFKQAGGSPKARPRKNAGKR